MKKFFAVFALSAFLFSCGESTTTEDVTTDTMNIETPAPAPAPDMNDSLVAPLDTTTMDTPPTQE